MNIDDQIKIIVENPDIKRVAIPILPLYKVVEKLAEYGFVHQDGNGQTNGCDVDFWEYFDHAERGEFCLFGSLWSGDYMFYSK